MRMCTVAIFIIVFALGLPADASKMLIHQSDGSVDTLEVSSIDKMLFSAEPLATRPHAGRSGLAPLTTSVRVVSDGILVHMAKAGELELQITDIRGRVVGAVPKQAVAAGIHRFDSGFTTTSGAGMYIVRVMTDGKTFTTRNLNLR